MTKFYGLGLAVPAREHGNGPTRIKTLTVWRTSAMGAFRSISKTTVIAMKLTTLLLLLVGLFTARADVAAQAVTLSGKNITLKQVFTAIKKQTGYVVLRNKDLPVDDKTATLSVVNMALPELLDRVLKDLPLKYSIQGKTIFLSRKPVEPVPTKTSLEAAPPVVEAVAPPITGRVLNADGQPLDGASVRVKGTKNGTMTDAAGRYSLEAAKGQVLVFSYTGYEAKEVLVGNDAVIHAVLKPLQSKLDEVQVIAYGTTSRRFSTSNIASVKAEDIEKQPVTNPILALQGRVPGLEITQSSGMPGGAITVKIQGQNSFRLSGNDPFYVVDGVPYAAQMLKSELGDGVLGNSYGGGPAGSPLNYINPMDIESIEVLKDADATSIYGSRAANGAILITTKKGKPGKMQVNLNLQQGITTVSKKRNYLNTEEYLAVRLEAKRNDNAAITATEYDINGTWPADRSTDWVSELYGKSGKYSNAQLGISGGTNVLNYSINAGYCRQETINAKRVGMDLANQTGSIHSSLGFASPNQKLKIRLGTMLLINQNMLPGSASQYALTLAPNAPALLNDDGSLNWDLDAAGNSRWGVLHPLYNQFGNTTKNGASNLVVNFGLNYRLLPGLDVALNLGTTRLQTDGVYKSRIAKYAPAMRSAQTGFAGYSNGLMTSWIVEPNLTYNKSIGELKMTALLGGTLQQDNRTGRSVSASGFTSDDMLDNIGFATAIAAGSSEYSTYKYAALFGRLNLNWANKYIVNANIRRDGSSRYGPANRFHTFSSIAGAWLFTSESFWKLPAFISSGKLRASYGETGSDGIGDYTFYDLYLPNAATIAYQGISAIGPGGLFNPNLQWEKTRKTSVGMDLGFFKDRLLITVNYQANASDNQIGQFNLPATTGHSFIQINFPKAAIIQNSSWEFSLNSTNVKTASFSWATNINFTIPKNKLVAPGVSKGEGIQFNTNSYFAGQSINMAQVSAYAGVDPATGVFAYFDANGNPTTIHERFKYIDLFTQQQVGIENSFTYKGFSLSLHFNAVRKMQKTQAYNNTGAAGSNSRVNNTKWVTEDHWQKPGDVSTRMKYATRVQSLFDYTDVSYEDGSYLRLKNTALSFDLKSIWTNMPAQHCRLTLNAQNLLTLTRFNGIDPETPNLLMPPLRTVTIGLNVNF